MTEIFPCKNYSFNYMAQNGKRCPIMETEIFGNLGDKLWSYPSHFCQDFFIEISISTRKNSQTKDWTFEQNVKFWPRFRLFVFFVCDYKILVLTPFFYYCKKSRSKNLKTSRTTPDSSLIYTRAGTLLKWPRHNRK